MWTHLYDGLIKLLLIALAIAIAIFALDQLPENNNSLPVVVFSLIFLLFALIYIFFFRTLSSYLYCKFSLKMPIEYQEAKMLNHSLAPLGGEWLPLKEVLAYPAKERHNIALQMQENWLAEREKTWLDEQDKFRNNSAWVKVAKILIYVSMVAILLLSLLNLPPASYISNLYAGITDSYYPVLNAFILYVPIVVLLLFIDKK